MPSKKAAERLPSLPPCSVDFDKLQAGLRSGKDAETAVSEAIEDTPMKPVASSDAAPAPAAKSRTETASPAAPAPREAASE